MTPEEIVEAKNFERERFKEEMLEAGNLDEAFDWAWFAAVKLCYERNVKIDANFLTAAVTIAEDVINEKEPGIAKAKWIVQQALNQGYYHGQVKQ